MQSLKTPGSVVWVHNAAPEKCGAAAQPARAAHLARTGGTRRCERRHSKVVAEGWGREKGSTLPSTTPPGTPPYMSNTYSCIRLEGSDLIQYCIQKLDLARGTHRIQRVLLCTPQPLHVPRPHRPAPPACARVRARAGYTIGMKRGPDTNTVMWSGSQWPERHTSRFSSSE